MVRAFLGDVRYAARLLRRAPAFTSVAVATLALGIGANTAIFSIVDAVLLQPLPYPQPDQLVVLSETVQRDSLERRPLSYPDFRDVRDRAKSFAAMTAWTEETLTLSVPGAPARQVRSELVTSSYFELLGASTSAGRTFTPAEADERDAHPVVALSHAFAERTFGSAGAAVGQSVMLNDHAFVVVGVLSRGFTGLSDAADVWVPFGMMSVAESPRFFDARGSRWLDGVARLNPDVTLAEARAELGTIGRQLEQSYPDTNSRYGQTAFDLKSETVGSLRPLLTTLLGAVGFVLLIACVNLANLLLARVSARSRETAIRSALGAGRRRIARQFLAEGILISALGAAAGVLVAMWSTGTIAALAPAGLPTFARPHVDWRVLLFVGALAVGCGALLGLLPAVHGSRTDLNEALKEGSRGSAGGPARARLRAALVIAEVALSLLLLVGAGLMVRSFVNLQRIDVGFVPDRAATLRIALPRKYVGAELGQTVDELLARVNAVPGIARAAAGTDAPFAGGTSAIIVTPEGVDPSDVRTGIRVYRHSITPGFFDVLGAPLVAGRDFSRADADTATPVAIVSRKFAAKAWPKMDPVGHRFRIGRGSSGDWLTVVGVAAEMRYRSLRTGVDAPEDPDVYFPFAQAPDRGLSVLARTALDPGVILAPIRESIQRFDRDVPVSDERPFTTLIGNRMAEFRLSASIMSSFGGIALLLAGIGVFGLINYSVAQRRRELGVRAALGATRGELYGLVLREALLLAGVGVGAGLLAAFPAARLIESQLYGVTASDPITYAAIVLLLAAVSLTAALVPASRAARVDPMIALRAE
ncbi:MAG TPA: ABC transporter permease [Vicinamibacterales bacterium]|nr:ABC transporter permease [Vicinamibacterales bacterium]